MAQTDSQKIVRTVLTVHAMAEAEGWNEEQELAEVSSRLGSKFDASKIKSRVNQLRKRLEDEMVKMTPAQKEATEATLAKLPKYTAAKRGKKFDVNALNEIAAEFEG